MEAIGQFSDFWPHYLRDHARPGTRAMHYVGTSMVLLLLAAMPLGGDWRMALALPIVGYGFAWTSHGVIERNRPATLNHPLWSLRADLRMWHRFMTGQLADELDRAGVRRDGTIAPVLP